MLIFYLLPTYSFRQQCKSLYYYYYLIHLLIIFTRLYYQYKNLFLKDWHINNSISPKYLTLIINLSNFRHLISNITTKKNYSLLRSLKSLSTPMPFLAKLRLYNQFHFLKYKD